MRRESQALCTPMMKFADSVGLCAPPHENRLSLCAAWSLREFISGSVHSHDEQPQAPCTLLMKIADSGRLCVPHDDICRPSQALCTPTHEMCRVSGSRHPSNEACRQRRALCPVMKTVERLSLRAPWFVREFVYGPVHSHSVICPTASLTPQALCTLLMKTADSRKLYV